MADAKEVLAKQAEERQKANAEANKRMESIDANSNARGERPRQARRAAGKTDG